MPKCPQCTKPLRDISRRCPSCQADLDLLVDYVSHLQGGLQRAEIVDADDGLQPAATQPPVYRLARDYAQCLKAYSIGDERLKAAAVYNLEHAPSFADWSFA